MRGSYGLHGGDGAEMVEPGSGVGGDVARPHHLDSISTQPSNTVPKSQTHAGGISAVGMSTTTIPDQVWTRS